MTPPGLEAKQCWIHRWRGASRQVAERSTDCSPHDTAKLQEGPRLRLGPFLHVCRACSIAWRWKSSTQPDGGEGLAKRKGRTVRWGLKEARSKHASRWTRTG